MELTIKRVSAVMGAEVTGLDPELELDDHTFQRLRSAWLDADGLLILKGLRLTPSAQVAFSERLGPLETHTLQKFLLPGYPQIYRVSSKRGEDGQPQGNDQAGRYWHSDLCYVDPPSMCSLLYALETPALGGDTLFCNMYAAYQALSSPMREFLRDKRAVHDFRHVLRNFTSFDRGDLTASTPPVSQPVVRTHPETGRKCLFVNSGFTTHIEGLARVESDAILEMLFAHCARSELHYRHRWQTGDAVLWDNRCTMHHAVADFRPEHGPRHMHRTTVLGAEPAF